MKLQPLLEALDVLKNPSVALNDIGLWRLRNSEVLKPHFDPFQRFTERELGLPITSKFPEDARRFVPYGKVPLGGLLRQKRQGWLSAKREERIFLDPSLGSSLGTKVLAHELGHYFLTPPSMTFGDAETLAEAASYLVTKELGEDTRLYSANYIRGNFGNPELLIRKEKELLDAAEQILRWRR